MAHTPSASLDEVSSPCTLSKAWRLAPQAAWPLVSLGSTALVLLSLAACGQSGDAAHAGGQMPPPQVGVITVQPASIELATELPGRLEAVRTAQVRARVTGVVQKRLFTEGSVVKAGQSLFAIDAAPYRAQLDSAAATQARADAALANAQATYDRYKPLADARAISQQDWVAAQAAQKQAVADLAAAKAGVTQARLNVDYAAVISPITGRIGRAEVTEGALVSATEATLLATVQQIDSLYVNFTQSATEALRLKRAMEAGKLQSSSSTKIKVLLDDGSEYPLPGKLLFSDLTVDPTSGQVTLRAELPNPKGELLPGLYVKVRIEQARSDAAILVPQQAVTRGTAGDTVLVVNAEKQTEPRPVQLSGTHGNQWVVLSGLKAGEQVVVDGFQKIRPKTPVSPVPWTPAGAASGAPAAPAASGAAPAASAASH
ncbi:efflux RND transporter periplasmic adaptor subunit [Ideonella azotifigens]|uniref:efflux RND transporter periplasmic adaptor subunit n=2 Tax=Ideonella azotifigens TaxID=513160 RepID=UPI001E586F8D|nr:efflux RND transporter periplasmic adaptor subunit [Ideonella azotifigens]MCD2343423.1 efflux RND transporter periplasmic adaptor subunit [Ideonella azotifigens]